MLLISPTINISIGNYGKISMDNLVANFYLREKQYAPYVSFHQLELFDERLTMHNFDKAVNSFIQEGIADYKLSESKSESFNYNLSTFITKAYNRLITLKNNLELNVNFQAIYINLIFAAFEEENLELIEETIAIINRFTEQGSFGGVKVSCFIILTDEREVLPPNKEKNIVKTLDLLSSAKLKYDVLSRHFIFDDKNTLTTSLNIENNYLSFAITEVLVALMRNATSMFGSLHNPNGFLGIGIGMVYFDKLYFQAFFKNRILESKLSIEKIENKKIDIETSTYKHIVEKIFLPFIYEEKRIDELVNEVKEIIEPTNFIYSLQDYMFILSYILGEYNKVTPDKLLKTSELFSIDDLIFHVLYNYILTAKEKEEFGLISVIEYKEKLAEYYSMNERTNSYTDSELEEQLQNHGQQVKNIIYEYSDDRKRKKLIPNLEDVKEKLENLQLEKLKLNENFEKKNWLSKLFTKRNFIKEKEKLTININELEIKNSEFNKLKNSLNEKLTKLYALKIYASDQLIILERGINDLKSLSNKYQVSYNSLPYIKMEFIHNIISVDKLYDYEFRNRDDQQFSLRDPLKLLFNKETSHDFYSIIDNKISTIVNNIIDFNMLSYLLKEYDSMNLLEKFNFTEDLKKLKLRSSPFFNAVPSYQNKSNYLKYFDNKDEKRTSILKEFLNDNYTGNIPSGINSESPNKFALITIDIIDDLHDIVKYNNQTKRK